MIVGYTWNIYFNCNNLLIIAYWIYQKIHLFISSWEMQDFKEMITTIQTIAWILIAKQPPPQKKMYRYPMLQMDESYED